MCCLRRRGRLGRAVLAALIAVAFFVFVPVSPAHAAGITERILALPFELLADFLQSLFKMPTADAWIYAQYPSGTPPEWKSKVFTPEAEIGGVFSQAEWDGLVKPWFESFQLVAWVLMAITITYTGLRIAAHKDSPRARAEMHEWIRSIILGGCVIAFTPLIVDLLFDLNLAIVKACAEAVGRGSEDFFKAGLGPAAGSGLGGAIVNLVWFGETLWFNLRYLLRKLLIMFLIILAPLAGWSATWQKKDTSLQLLFGELVSNVFIQAAHALVFTMFLKLWEIGNSLGSSGFLDLQAWWLKPAMIGFLIPVSGIVGKMINTWLDLIGIDEDRLVGGAMARVAGVAALGGVLVSMLPGPGRTRGGGAGFGGRSGGGSAPPGTPWTVGAPEPPEESGSYAAGAQGGAGRFSGWPPAAAGGGLPSAGYASGGAGGQAGGAVYSGGAAGGSAVSWSSGGASGAGRAVSGPVGQPALAGGPGLSGPKILYGPTGQPLRTVYPAPVSGGTSGGAPAAGPAFAPAAQREGGTSGAGAYARQLPGYAVRAAGVALSFATSQRDALTGQTVVDTRPLLGRPVEVAAQTVDRYWGVDDIKWA